MDADEATDFVGGSENKIIGRQDVIEKTTAAVHSLLGIDVFKKASRRLITSARSFGAQATKAVGDSDLDALQAELEHFRRELEGLDKKIVGERNQKTEFEDRLRRRRDDLETELKNVGAAEELRTRLSTNRENYNQAARTRESDVSPSRRRTRSDRPFGIPREKLYIERVWDTRTALRAGSHSPQTS